MSTINVCIFLEANKKLQYKNISQDLQTFLDILQCDTIDIVQRRIGDKMYSFVIDSKAHTKDRLVLSYCDKYDINATLYGSFLIVGPELDSYGNFVAVSYDDYQDIKNHMFRMRYHDPKTHNLRINTAICAG